MAWPDKAFLTVDQAAHLLQRHPEQVRRYLREGRFPGALKLGLMWYVPKAEVRTLARHRRGSAASASLGSAVPAAEALKRPGGA